MTNKKNNAYINQPQSKTNQSLNKNMTPDVPKFSSNAMDNQGLIPLDICSCNCHDDKEYKNQDKEDDKKGYHCNHK
ncbi:hypothetical protein [Terrisporobacter sp.]